MKTLNRQLGFNPAAPYWLSLKAAETRIITSTLEAAGQDPNAAAALLGVSRSYLDKRCLVLGIKVGTMGRRRSRDYSRAYPMRYDPAGDGADE